MKFKFYVAEADLEPLILLSDPQSAVVTSATMPGGMLKWNARHIHLMIHLMPPSCPALPPIGSD